MQYIICTLNRKKSLIYTLRYYFRSNTINKHFHCVRAGCGFSFTRYTQMAQHLLQHQATAGLQITDKLGNDPLIFNIRLHTYFKSNVKPNNKNNIIILTISSALFPCRNSNQGRDHVSDEAPSHPFAV